MYAGFGGFGEIFYGKEDGSFAKGVPIVNEKGIKVNMGSYWCDEQSIWTSFAKEKIKKGGLSEAEIAKLKEEDKASTHFSLLTVVDWDNDGDYDLILNSQPKTADKRWSQKPRVCLNIRSKTNPVFSSETFEIEEIDSFHYAETVGD